MSDAKSQCGPHATLFSDEGIRLTQCPCGVYHLAMQRRGMSIQLGADEARSLAGAMGVAMKVMDAEARGRAMAACTDPILN